MANNNEQALGEDQTLAHLLEFLSRLEESESVKTKVITEIKEKVEEYFKDYDQQFGNSTTGYLFETIKESSDLMIKIVGSEENFDHYTKSFHDSDANKYSQHLIDNVFPLFGCLYYMYYECSYECYYIQGAEWQDEKCNETGKDLNQWLRDQKGDTGRMIKRGFEHIDLSQNDGKILFPGDSNALLDYTTGGQLQSALFYMLFLPDHTKWNNAQSGHAVLFLETFCQMVKDGDFNGQYTEADSDTFKTACQNIQQSIENIRSITGVNIIVPVAWYQKVKYRDLLEAKHFWKYIGWLIKNLEELIKSLKDMESDISNWNKNTMKTSSSYGPLPWGFVLKANWENKTGQFKSKLQELITALKTFQSALVKIKPVSSSAATVGGVIGGLGAAGAAGAAAAYSGVLGTAAEGIGKFVKGLLF